MNQVFTRPDWLSLAGLIALEITIMAGAAAARWCLTRAAIWRRTIWHVCLLGLTGLVMFELTEFKGLLDATDASKNPRA